MIYGLAKSHLSVRESLRNSLASMHPFGFSSQSFNSNMGWYVMRRCIVYFQQRDWKCPSQALKKYCQSSLSQPEPAWASLVLMLRNCFLREKRMLRGGKGFKFKIGTMVSKIFYLTWTGDGQKFVHYMSTYDITWAGCFDLKQSV